MPNMSYCRFQNTVKDLRDCQDEFDNVSSIEEAKAAVRLYEMCQQIADTYDLDDLQAQLAELVKEDEEEPV